MLTKENIARLMQISALIMVFMGIVLGGIMVSEQGPKHAPARAELRDSLANLQASVDAMAEQGSTEMSHDMTSEGGEMSEDMGAMHDTMNPRHDLINATANTVLADAAKNRNEGERRGMRVGHAHVNLESIWVIAASLVLLHLNVSALMSNVIGAAFILGSWAHGGMMALGQYGQGWAYSIMSTGAGPFLLMAGIALLILAIIMDWRAKS